jgi:gas vesicle protein
MRRLTPELPGFTEVSVWLILTRSESVVKEFAIVIRQILQIGARCALFGGRQRPFRRRREFTLVFKEESDMSESFKNKAEQAGNKVAEKAKDVGHKVAEKATEAGNAAGEKFEQGKDWAKDKAHQVGNKIEEAGDAAKKKIHEATK